MPDLTESDYDALFAAMKDDMPPIQREMFPHALAQLEGTGVLTITVTDTEITVSSTQQSATAVYRVKRQRRYH